MQSDPGFAVAIFSDCSPHAKCSIVVDRGNLWLH